MNTQQEQSQKCIFKIVHMNKLTKNYNVRGLILTSTKKKKKQRRARASGCETRSLKCKSATPHKVVLNSFLVKKTNRINTYIIMYESIQGCLIAWI
jgi:hypothetical protein